MFNTKMNNFIEHVDVLFGDMPIVMNYSLGDGCYKNNTQQA